MKRLAFEVQVSRTFTIKGGDYCENWEAFKRELGLLHDNGRWEIPSKFDRGRTPEGLFADEAISEHVELREFTRHLGWEIYAAHEECPNCFCDDTFYFSLTQDGTGNLDPLAKCGNCGLEKLFCNLTPGSSARCVACLHRVRCIVK